MHNFNTYGNFTNWPNANRMQQSNRYTPKTKLFQTEWLGNHTHYMAIDARQRRRKKMKENEIIFSIFSVKTKKTTTVFCGWYSFFVSFDCSVFSIYVLCFLCAHSHGTLVTHNRSDGTNQKNTHKSKSQYTQFKLINKRLFRTRYFTPICA